MALRIPTKQLRIQAREKAGKITTKGRRALGKGQFALPDGDRPSVAGRFPMDTIERARNALARAQQKKVGLSDAQKATIRRKVCAKYPSIATCKK